MAISFFMPPAASAEAIISARPFSRLSGVAIGISNEASGIVISTIVTGPKFVKSASNSA